MILTDQQIRRALNDGRLTIKPAPQPAQFSPTALDLHLGRDLLRFRPALYRTKGLSVTLDLDALQIIDLEPFLEPLPTEKDGSTLLLPGELVIATTMEWVDLPRHGMLAARVEGRSRFARLGLVIHMTAPTIHNSFRGNITLEMMNHGPLPLQVRPEKTRICQLIFERLDEAPAAELASPFQGQTKPLGT